MRPILYTFRRCPYAIRARLALAKCGVDYHHREVSLKDKPSEMIAISAKATVPVLQNEGSVIDESLHIMEWAVMQSGQGDWGKQLKNKRLISRNDEFFKPWLDKYKYFDRYPEQPQSYYFEQACTFLGELDLTIGRGELDPITSFSSAAIFPFVRQFAFVDKAAFDALDYSSLQAWLEEWLNSDVFEQVMFKTPFWNSTHTELSIMNSSNASNK